MQYRQIWPLKTGSIFVLDKHCELLDILPTKFESEMSKKGGPLASIPHLWGKMEWGSWVKKKKFLDLKNLSSQAW